MLAIILQDPVPSVRAWCSGADSAPVGAKYFMYDKIGVPLQLFDPFRELSIKVKHIPLGYRHTKNIATIF